MLEVRAHSIFLDAVEREPDTWADFLSSACGPDDELRARVVQLLQAHSRLGTIDLTHALAPAPLVRSMLSEVPGAAIGPYRLLKEIGEGGFGVVYLAEQSFPVRRQVALKVIKPGMDSRQFVARFEAERQALALMDHPNIAHVFDGGETVTGRPYLVMELVRGAPITEFCDRKSLSVRQRIELFVAVCQAVQHAHQKGIIHRDLKPSNVLVTLDDEQPGSQGDRLRHRESAGSAADREDAFHRVRPDDRHTAVYESRAGPDGRTRHRHADRHLRARASSFTSS